MTHMFGSTDEKEFFTIDKKEVSSCINTSFLLWVFALVKIRVKHDPHIPCVCAMGMFWTFVMYAKFL